MDEVKPTQNEKMTAEAVLQYGGQAVIEGVMMRSKHYFAVACRRPDGQIVVQREEVDKSIIGKLKWLNKPFLRGTLALIDAMALGPARSPSPRMCSCSTSRSRKARRRSSSAPTREGARGDPRQRRLSRQRHSAGRLRDPAQERQDQRHRHRQQSGLQSGVRRSCCSS